MIGLTLRPISELFLIIHVRKFRDKGEGVTVSYKFVKADINILKVYSNMLGYSQKVIVVNFLHMAKF